MVPSPVKSVVRQHVFVRRAQKRHSDLIQVRDLFAQAERGNLPGKRLWHHASRGALKRGPRCRYQNVRRKPAVTLDNAKSTAVMHTIVGPVGVSRR